VSKEKLLTAWLESDWNSVKGMVTPRGSQTLLDVVFSLAATTVRVIGKAHTISNSFDEAFSLDIYEHRASGWWEADGNGKTRWVPRDLVAEWQGMPHYAILKAPRWYCAYTDLELMQSPSKPILDQCAAFEFRTADRDPSSRLVLLASRDSPCAVEILIAPSDCDEALTRLQAIGGLI